MPPSNARRPINRLPPELLQHIFVLSTSSPRILSHVCNHWRSVLFQAPVIWASTLNTRDGPRWIAEVLKRSGSCLLGIVANPTLDYSVSRSARHRAGNVWNIILREMKRIQKLHITIENKADLRVVLDALNRYEAPLLESLAIKSGVRMDEITAARGVPGTAFGLNQAIMDSEESMLKLSSGLFRGNAPKLKSLSLAMVYLGLGTSTLRLSLPWARLLTSLHVTDQLQRTMSVWEWLSVLRQTPLLERLVLRNMFADEVEPEYPEEAAKVLLKRLKSVELKGIMMECCELLTKLVLPGQCAIHIDAKRANNMHAVKILCEFLTERKIRAGNMEDILKTPYETMKEARERKDKSLLVHPSMEELNIKIEEGVEEWMRQTACGSSELDLPEGHCPIHFLLKFGGSQSDHVELVIEIFEALTRCLHMVYEDKGGFRSLNLSLFKLKDTIKTWETHLVHFLARLDNVEHLQEVSGYTATVLFPILAQTSLQRQNRTSSSIGMTTSPSERYRQNVLLPSLQRITLAFVEFSTNVDDEFEGCCDVCALPSFVRQRLGLGLEVGGRSVLRQRTLKFVFECCSGPKWILEDVKTLPGVECALGWACDFEDS